MDKTLSKDELYDKYQNLIHFIIKKYFGIKHPLFDYEDLFQEGCLAMCVAYDRYDPEKSEFISYLYSYIKGYVTSFLCRHTSSYSFIKHHREEAVTGKEIRLDSLMRNSDSDHDIAEEYFGKNDTDLDLVEYCEAAKNVARNDKFYQAWYEVYILENSQVKVAKNMGVSRQRINQMTTDVNDKLKSALLTCAM